MNLRIQRIDSCAEDAARRIAELRKSLGVDGGVVSERGQGLTRQVFGEPLSPRQSVERIVEDVRARGFGALQHYTHAFDGFALTAKNLRVRPGELAAAHRQTDDAFLATIRRVRQQILAYQSGILHRDAVLRDLHRELRLRYRPVGRAGVCIPGGAAAYPSTLLMTAVPAQAAGVAEIAVVAPPTANGANNPSILAVCHELGLNEVYRAGGAQAVAALAYGVEGLPRVDMIVGPGNIFVALAKQYVSGQVGIDMIAGPSEVVVLADDSANPAYVAADLIAQAEHEPGVSILITWHDDLIEAVLKEMTCQLKHLPRGEPARRSLEQFGALIHTHDEDEAIELANQLAPEHLQLCTRNPEALVERIEHAGAIFVGETTPTAVGDYVAGPSHVLPTGGTARFASGLSANDFLRRTSVIHFSRDALEAHAADLRRLAEVEGLTAHSACVDVRLTPNRRPTARKTLAATH